MRFCACGSEVALRILAVGQALQFEPAHSIALDCMCADSSTTPSPVQKFFAINDAGDRGCADVPAAHARRPELIDTHRPGQPPFGRRPIRAG
jgi:hypothetical protein